MCVIYFSSNARCDHKHFLGSFHCAHPGCNIDSQHLFTIEDSGYECSTCAHLDGPLDPDLEEFPAKAYSPVPSMETKMVREPGMWYPKVVVVSQAKADGDTAPPPGFKYPASRVAVSPKPKPSQNTEKHRKVVLDQLAKVQGPFYIHRPQAPVFRSLTPVAQPSKLIRLPGNSIISMPPPSQPSYPVYHHTPPMMGGEHLGIQRGSPIQPMPYNIYSGLNVHGVSLNPQAPEWQAKMKNWHMQKEAWKASQRRFGGI